MPNCKNNREVRAGCASERKRRIWDQSLPPHTYPLLHGKVYFKGPLYQAVRINCVFRGSSGIPFPGKEGALSFYRRWQIPSDRVKWHRVDVGVLQKVFRWSANFIWRNKQGWPLWNRTHKSAYLSTSSLELVTQCPKSWYSLPFHLIRGSSGHIFANKNNSSPEIAYLLSAKTAGVL